MAKSIALWSAIFGGTIAVLVLLIVSNNSSKPRPIDPTINIIRADDWVRGNPQSALTLVEYGDFQCPACKQYEPLLQQLLADFDGKLALVYRHFPLPGHGNAKPAIWAAEAAGKQGKFWEMHDLLFDKQDEWKGEGDPAALFAGYASALSLDAARFAADFQSPDVKNRAESGLAESRRLDLNSTPSFFVKGELIHPQTYEAFKDLIDRALR